MFAVIRLADKAGRACPALKDLGMGAEVNKGAAMRPEENNVDDDDDNRKDSDWTEKLRRDNV